MAKKGRPFTYQSDDDRPVTLSVRLPAELTDLVKRYAATHGQIPISELIREGLEWRIGDGDPRGMGMYLREPTDRSEKEYDCNTGIASTPQGQEVLQEVRALLARQWEQIQALAQALERQRVLASDGVYSSNTRIEPGKQEQPAEQEPDNDTASIDIMPLVPTARAEATISHYDNTVIQSAEPKRRGRKVPANVLQAAQSPALVEDTSGHNANVPAFDTARYYLGKLCPKGHDFDGTGQTLLRKHNQSCRDCENEGKREKRKAKRQEVSAWTRP